jgi:hypothetical protein
MEQNSPLAAATIASLQMSTENRDRSPAPPAMEQNSTPTTVTGLQMSTENRDRSPAPPAMEQNSTSTTVAGLQMSNGNLHPILSHGGNLGTATPPAFTLASLSNEQNLSPGPVVSSTGGLTNPAYHSVDTIPSSDVVMEESTSSVALAPLPTGTNLSLPSAVDSDGAPAALRKGSIMRPNPQSTTAR